jgi:hypothetical protein
LIEQVLAMTAALIPHARPEDRDRLFLIDNMNSSRIVGVIPNYLVSAHVRRFVKRHDLRDDLGRPLQLSIAALRASGLTLAHERLGHDILKTQALANHATPDTTQRYVDRPLVRQAQAIAVGALQARFVEIVRGSRMRKYPNSLTSTFAVRRPRASSAPIRWVGRRKASVRANSARPGWGASPARTRSSRSMWRCWFGLTRRDRR